MCRDRQTGGKAERQCDENKRQSKLGSYRHKIGIDVVGVWLGVLNGQPHPTVVIYIDNEKQRKVSYIVTHICCNLRFLRFSLTW